MLDAYTEGPGTTQGLSDSEKFKEGYVKKGKGKVKNPPKKTVEVSSWLNLNLTHIHDDNNYSDGYDRWGSS